MHTSRMNSPLYSRNYALIRVRPFGPPIFRYSLDAISPLQFQKAPSSELWSPEVAFRRNSMYRYFSDSRPERGEFRERIGGNRSDIWAEPNITGEMAKSIRNVRIFRGAKIFHMGS